jgi:hypothetical protein
MQQDTIQILLAEYDRLKTIEALIHEGYEHAVQMYVAIITAAIGVLIILLQRSDPNSLSLSLTLLLGGVFLIGEFTFLHLLGLDTLGNDARTRMAAIRAKFIQSDTTLMEEYQTGQAQRKKERANWSSVRGIFRRAFILAQYKTMIVFVNSLVGTALVIYYSEPSTIWIGLIEGVLLMAVLGSLHAVYASWRYRHYYGLAQPQTTLGDSETRWWM